MKVVDVLNLCSCRVDIYYKGQFVFEYNGQEDLNQIEDWLLDSEVKDLDSSNDYIGDLLEIDSR